MMETQSTISLSTEDWLRMIETFNQMIDVVRNLQQRADMIDYHIRVFEQRISTLELQLDDGK